MNNIEFKTTREAALFYAELGRLVLPIHTPIIVPDTAVSCSCGNPDCSSIGKHPRTTYGLKDATSDPKQIKNWWDRWPDANIGLRTGLEIGFFAIDIDFRHDGFETLKILEAELGQLPETYNVVTGGGGMHFYYCWPKDTEIKSGSNVLGPGIDIKAAGGYVVAPPSLHSSGNEYEINNRIPVADLESKAWLDRIVKRVSSAQPAGQNSMNKPKQIDDTIPAGERNNTLTSLAGSMRNRNADVEEIDAALQTMNENRCNPPLSEDEVRKISESIGSKPAGQIKQNEKDKQPPKNIATRLVEIVDVLQGVELFHAKGITGDNEAYATIPVDDHRETLAVKSASFGKWLSRQGYFEYGSVPNRNAIQEAIATISSMAEIERPEKTIAFRLAGYENKIYLDLCNSQWQVVEISANDWKVISSEDCPVRFIRRGMAKALPLPAKGTITPLREFINVADEEQYKLIIGWLIGSFSPKGPYPILSLAGEQGSGKSGLTRILRNFSDPNKIPLRKLSGKGNDRDLLPAIYNSRILALDNVSSISAEVSDDLCRIATGTGLSTRQLYADVEEVTINACCPIILNGIPDCISHRSDLADRTICIHLKSIPDNKRKTELIIEKELESVYPNILGGILTAVCEALKNHNTITIESLPRMADFVIWVTAAEPGLGWQPESFLQAYNKQHENSAHNLVEFDSIGPAVLELAEKGEWSGTPTALFNTLGSMRKQNDYFQTTGWPKNIKTMTTALKRLQPSLRKFGIDVELDGHTGRGAERRRNITIRKR